MDNIHSIICGIAVIAAAAVFYATEGKTLTFGEVVKNGLIAFFVTYVLWAIGAANGMVFGERVEKIENKIVRSMFTIGLCFACGIVAYYVLRLMFAR